MSGYIFAHITCTRVKWEEDAKKVAKALGIPVADLRESSDWDPEDDTVLVEDGIEESGWIDFGRNPYVLHDSRDDVRPIVDCGEDSEELTDEVREALEWLEGYRDNGNGTFYAADPIRPHGQPWSYHYALHFTKKDIVNGVWSEVRWIPPMEMRP